ncbi:unnamed protein product [Caenorhabditis angaria]|uniref:Kinetochore protein Nuf2 N-terminal domain-containing protein n=1 Tax=Caenorhabditis angaria TaxID=860376 RepID=A0A9P1I664_9PELO|nr:unnamed protein product [Caenorhabditis angaria]
MASRQVTLNILDPRTISDFLSKRLKISLTAECILQPTAAVVQEVCTGFLRVALDVEDQQLSVLPLSVNLDLDIDAHRQSIPVTIVFQALKGALTDITGDHLDLTMCDLVRPWKAPARIKKLFSFFVDFLKLLEVMRPQFDTVLEEFTQKRVELEEYQELMVVAEGKKKALIDQESTRKRRELDLFNTLKTVQSEFNQVVDNYKKLNRLIAELDKKTNDNLEEMKRLDLDSENARKTIDHLSVELLSSPNRVRNETEKQRQELKEIEEFSTETKKNLQEREKALEICARAEKQIGWIMERAKVLKTDKLRVQEYSDRVSEKKTNLAELDQQFGFIVNKLNMETGLVATSLENHNQMKSRNEKRLEELQQRLNTGIMQIENLKKDCAPSTNEAKSKMATILSIKNSISEYNRKTDEYIKEMVEELKKMKSTFDANQMAALENSRFVERASDRLKTCLDF